MGIGAGRDNMVYLMEKDMKRVDGDVIGLYDTMRWALTTFHGTEVPKAKRHDN